MAKGVLLFVLLFSAVAQVFPSCSGEGNSEIVGFVDEKYIQRSAGAIEYVLVVNRTLYEVPANFWQTANVGDIVKYDGMTWTIVRKRSERLTLPFGTGA